MNIYISKPGVMTAAGVTIDELWDSVVAGNQSAIKRVKACNGVDFFAAKIDEGKLKSASENNARILKIEQGALNQISDDIEIVKSKYGSERVAVCIGSCDNGEEQSIAADRVYLETQKFPEDFTLEVQSASYVAKYIAARYGLKGPANTFSTACSSSAGAIIKGAELILAGLVDAVVVGGVDTSSDTVLVGFNALEAVSPEITNPLSKNRHGITLGEGASFFILTKEPIHPDDNIQLLGWGESSDAYHMTSPDPSGEGAIKAIRRAIESAKISPKDVDYINMHGTGTKLNDSMESIAIDKIFGDYKVPVSSTKPVTGHTLGAAAAVEAAICYKAINNVALPVHVWDKEYDSELPNLNIVEKNYSANKKIKICLSNSFAFGGANACLAIGIR